MTAVTWLAVAVLGIGSVTVFGFFLRDLGAVFPPSRRDDQRRG
jgi:hypothetical protein